MDLSLTEDQESIRDLFSTFFEKEVPSEVVREHEALGFAPDVWSRLRDTGAFAMSISEANGGGGVGLFESALVAEEVGRRVAPVPFAEHVVAARLLERVGARPTTCWRGSSTRASPRPSLSTPLGRDARLVPAGAVAGVVIALDVSSGDLVAVEEHTARAGGRQPRQPPARAADAAGLGRRRHRARVGRRARPLRSPPPSTSGACWSPRCSWACPTARSSSASTT